MIDTDAKRNSALLDLWPVILPDGDIGREDRATLIGQYPMLTEFGDVFNMTLYVQRATPLNAYIQRVPSVTTYINRAWALNLYREN